MNVKKWIIVAGTLLLVCAAMASGRIWDGWIRATNAGVLANVTLNGSEEQSTEDIIGILEARLKTLSPKLLDIEALENFVSIKIFDSDFEQLELFEKMLSTAGKVELRPLIDMHQFPELYEYAKNSEYNDRRFVFDRSGKPIGEWVTISPESEFVPRFGLHAVRTEKTKMWIGDMRMGLMLKEDGENFEVLTEAGDVDFIRNHNFKSVKVESDHRGEDCVHGVMDDDGARKLYALTKIIDQNDHEPMNLAIIVDNKVWAAPTVEEPLRDRLQIKIGDGGKCQFLVGLLSSEEVNCEVEFLTIGSFGALR
jgi:hypothetical protein